MVEAFRRRLAFDPANVPPFARLVPLRLFPSYIIYIEDTIIKALNCQTGEVDFSGTDASTVIQEAIDALTEGGTIVIKSGTYVLSSQLNLCSNLVLLGEGRSTILKLKDGANYNALQADTKEKIIISNLAIDGNREKIDTTAPMYTTLNCIRLLNSNDIIVENCFLFNVYYFGVRTEGCKRIQIKGNTVWAFRDQGISLNTTTGARIANNVVYNGTDATYTGGYIGISVWRSDRVTASGNIVHDVGPADGFGCGIRCEGSENVTIVANVCYNNVVDGVSAMRWDAYVSKNILIVGNLCYGNGVGIRAEYGEYITIVGNASRENTERGIYVKVITHPVIESNFVYSNATQNIFLDGCTEGVVVGNFSAKSGGNEGIIIISSDNVLIANNKVMENPVRGIDLRSSNGCVIANNIVKNNNASAIYLENSSNCLIIGNKCFDDREVKDQDYGFQESGTSDYNKVIDNDFRDNVAPVSLVGANTICKRNLGYVTENKGVETFSGDGVTTSFSWVHGLVSTPSKILVTPKSADAAITHYVSADATNITITFSSAPAAGTDNVVIAWEAEV